MRYFSGFCLENEEELFSKYAITGSYSLLGFSYGAVKAFEYAYNSKNRVDRLILISPAFFQTQKKSFISTQLRYFKRDNKNYINQFLKNVSYPSDINISDYLRIGTTRELEELLAYKWDKDKIKEVLNKGTVIEIFLGEKDTIIDSRLAYEFFREVATVYFIKDVGHILK